MSKEASDPKATRERKRPAYFDDFETNNKIIDAACKPDNNQTGDPGRELFKDDIYECIHMIFKGDDIHDVTDYIQEIIGKREIRTVLTKLNNPDRECLVAKTRAKKGDNMINYKGRGVRTTKNTRDKKKISKNKDMGEALDQFPIIKKYTGTERTSFIQKHYKDIGLAVPTNKATIRRMLIHEYGAHADNIIPDNDNKYGIKSFELNVNPTRYGYCGQCWLCNQPVYYYHGAFETTSCGDCEHVAGIVVGMLTGLLAFQGQDLMVYAYQPSHVHCNRFKNDDITIKFENGVWTPDEVSIKKIVEYIANDDAVYGSEYCPMLKARFKEAIKPETERTIYDKYKENAYDADKVRDYKEKCTTSIRGHSNLLCNAINDHYSLLNNEKKSEMQQTSKWVNTIASFFKHNPPPKQSASSGKMFGGMDGPSKGVKRPYSGTTENISPNNKRYGTSVQSYPRSDLTAVLTAEAEAAEAEAAEAEEQLKQAIKQLKQATNQLQQATTADQLYLAKQLQSQLYSAEQLQSQLQYQLQYQLQLHSLQLHPLQLHPLQYPLQQLQEATAAAKNQLQQLQQAAAGQQQQQQQQRQLAGHTLNLLNAAVMLLYMNPKLSFMECMHEAGRLLGQPVYLTVQQQADDGDTQKTDTEEFSQPNVSYEQYLQEEYNRMLFYYDNYNTLVNDFQTAVKHAKSATGDKDDGDGGDENPFPDCNPVIYISDPNQGFKNYVNEKYVDKDGSALPQYATIDTGSSNSGEKDDSNDESNYCFEDIAKCILCNRHQQKINEGDTQLHIYVPVINETTASTGKHGGMLKKPKQRKTRKHNEKKKKRTIRKNKQHTKRTKRTFKKKSHKKSNKSQ